MSFNCPITGLNIQKLFVSTIIGFIFLFAFEYTTHHILLLDIYQATANLWRTPAEMSILFPWVLASMFISTLFFAIAYGVFAKGQGLKRTLGFGFIIGAIMGVCGASSYLYMPVPLVLSGAWFAAAVAEGVMLSLIFRETFCCKGCKSGMKTDVKPVIVTQVSTPVQTFVPEVKKAEVKKPAAPTVKKAATKTTAKKAAPKKTAAKKPATKKATTAKKPAKKSTAKKKS